MSRRTLNGWRRRIGKALRTFARWIEPPRAPRKRRESPQLDAFREAAP